MKKERGFASEFETTGSSYFITKTEACLQYLYCSEHTLQFSGFTPIEEARFTFLKHITVFTRLPKEVTEHYDYINFAILYTKVCHRHLQFTEHFRLLCFIATK
jgi:hypothetical protein